MRKFYVALLSLFLLLVWSHQSKAQVSAYGVIQSTTTYTPITGGTTVHGSGWDDSQVSVTLPFTFTFNGTGYTSVTVSSNGFVSFGATAPGTTNYAPISSATGYAGAVSAFGRDIISNASTVESVIDGTAPSRKLIVQWNNARRYNLGAVTGDVLNFQIVLTETSNTIQVIYGTCTATNTTALFAQVGLRGATNADFNNRTTTTDWNVTFPGGVNTATCISTNTIMPASGLTFTWLPPSPCVAPPGGGTTVGPSGTFCTGQTFTLAVNGSSFGTGLTYQWESSTNGGGLWTPVTPGGTGQMLTTSITTNTMFRRKITCGGVDAYSTDFNVILSPPIATPFSENFAGYATLFPPACWSRNNTDFLFGVAASAFGTGTGSAIFEFYDASAGTNLDLTTPQFVPLPAGRFLTFDHAYATFLGGEVDELRILYSTDGGNTYTNLTTYLGGVSGPLNTGGANLFPFTPTATQWASKVVALPAGTNRIIFRGASSFGNNLYVDNIAIVSCVPPSGLDITAISQTTATLDWNDSPSNPSSGYEWEVRTSGAPGSGGATAQGTTLAGVTTANVTGLTANTTYTYYVRSVCGAGDFSNWSVGFTFITPCNPIAIPFTETFASSTFPPTCWNRSNTFSIRSTTSAYGNGTGSALFNFYDAQAGTVIDLVSPPFAPAPANYRLTFDHAYATFAGEVDQLQIFYSTDGGGTYTLLTTYLGGTSGPLNTGGAVLPPFAPVATQWDEKAVALPVGTNRIRLRGISAFGNNLLLDNITVAETPSCLPVSGRVTALPISPTSMIVSFNASPSPGVTYVVEVGPVGFTPGTGATPGAGGVITTGTASPITVNGLTANTAYDIYVRRECVTNVDYSTNKKATATTLCNATNIPYLQTFETATVPALPTCTSMQDVNGASGSFWFGTGGGAWETYTDNNPLSWVSPNRSLLYYYDFNNLSRPADDWFYTQGLNLTAGTTYRLKFFYKALDGANYPERLEVKYGTLAHAPAMTSGTLFTNNNIGSVYANPFDSVRVDFTPTASGVYYLGFHAMSDADMFGILIDNIEVKTAPVVDMGVTGVTLPAINCPTSGVFVQAKIKNFNLTPINFATHPITVTASITGAATGTLTTTINTGTLDPNATRDVYLNPAFNFTAAGLYNISVATSSPFDTETGNDAMVTSVNVNPAAAVPVITPSNAAICIGGQVQLSTQFTGTPPAPVTMPAVSSGTIAVAVPDGSAVGTTHSLNVTGVPVGATITGIAVTVNMTHTWVSDMAINLRAPNGRILNLFNQRGGSGDNLTGTVFSSTATTPIGSGAPPFTGTFLPDAQVGFGPSASLSEATAFSQLFTVGNGTWTLGMRDYVGFDAGTLTSWQIVITYQMLPPAITWSPTAGLFTDATATTPYTGTNLPAVYAKPSAAGTYTYTATATTSGGCTATGTATVTVNPLPVITIAALPDTVCTSDQTIALDAEPVGGSWTGTGVSGTNFLPPATAVGTYTLTYNYTSPAGCASTATDRIAVKDCPERIIRLADNALILYPNPNNGLFNIRVNSVLYNYLTMKVFTREGALVRTQQLSGLVWGRVIPIDLTNLPGGVYMVHFYYDGGVRTSEKTFKVIVATP